MAEKSSITVFTEQCQDLTISVLPWWAQRKIKVSYWGKARLDETMLYMESTSFSLFLVIVPLLMYTLSLIILFSLSNIFAFTMIYKCTASC